jgi:hypothetical protein
MADLRELFSKSLGLQGMPLLVYQQLDDSVLRLCMAPWHHYAEFDNQ